MSAREDNISETLRKLLAAYRNSPFDDEHIISVYMAALRQRGVFRAEPGKTVATEATPATADLALPRAYLGVNDDDRDLIDLWCGECDEAISDYLDSPTIEYLIGIARDHHREYHS